jgi:CBS domain-containing protein
MMLARFKIQENFQEVNTMQVAEVMTRHVEVIDPNAPLREAVGKMKSLDVGLIPVCDGDKLRGTLTDRDITVRGVAEGYDPSTLTDRDITVRGVAEGYDPSKTKVADIMSTDLAYCFEDDEIEAALDLMEKRQIRRLPVLSREKELVGIVSLGDLAVHTGQKKRVGETLEEVSQPATPRR